MNCRTLIAIVCILSVVNAACNAGDVNCENPIHFDIDGSKFYITEFSPKYNEQGVSRDLTISLKFSEAIPESEDLDGFFFLLNQSTGVTYDLKASCIERSSKLQLRINVYECINNVLDANAVYVFFISQKIEDDVVSLTSESGLAIDENPFGLFFNHLLFKTIDNIPIEVDRANCVPKFGEEKAPQDTPLVIAFTKEGRLGSGSIHIVAKKHPDVSINFEITDLSHVYLSEDRKKIVLLNYFLNGNEEYTIVVSEGALISDAGSKSLAVNDFTFTTEENTKKPYLVYTTPKNYAMNVPSDLNVILTFSEIVIPNQGYIVFTSTERVYRIHVANSNEVKCYLNECLIRVKEPFVTDTYEMSITESVFQDYAGHYLANEIRSIYFTLSEKPCSMEYFSVGDNSECHCGSIGNECRCQCGETFFVKKY